MNSIWQMRNRSVIAQKTSMTKKSIVLGSILMLGALQVTFPERTSAQQMVIQKDHSPWWVRDTVFSNDGRLVASCGWGGDVALWHEEDGVVLSRRSVGETANCVSFSPDGTLLGVAVDSEIFLTLTVPELTIEATVASRLGSITSFEFVSDSEVLVGGTEPPYLQLTKLSDLSLIHI